MAVKIRLSRIGKKKVPFFRIVAVDERRKRDGAFLADIGTYDVLKGAIVVFKDDLMKEWLSKGAIPTDSVKKIYRMYKKSNTAQSPSVPEKKTTPKKKSPSTTKK